MTTSTTARLVPYSAFEPPDIVHAPEMTQSGMAVEGGGEGEKTVGNTPGGIVVIVVVVVVVFAVLGGVVTYICKSRGNEYM